MRRYHQHQAIARKNKLRLFFYMGIMQYITITMIGLVFGYLVAVWGVITSWDHLEDLPFYEVLLTVAVFIMPIAALYIAGTAIWKYFELKEGGRKVAELLRAERIPSDTKSFHERQVLNVVEELAISAGVPVPPVYIMYSEPGINALAAGHTAEDAVVVVTEGACRRLNRDQIQGVVAHEFAHILNGDIGRNMLLMALTHGNYALILAAQAMIDSEGSGDESDVFVPVAYVAGLVLWPLGLFSAAVALLFMALIKRQGEFDADATAVELTRLPDGLCEALLKIGGNEMKGAIRRSCAFKASHLFFADSGWSVTKAFDPHPPLTRRIRRLRPDWDGCYLYEGEDELGEYEGVYSDLVELVGITGKAGGSADKKQALNKTLDRLSPLSSVFSGDQVHDEHLNGHRLSFSGIEASDGHADEPEVESPDWLREELPYDIALDPVFLELSTQPEGAALILAAIRLSQLEPSQAEQVLESLQPAILRQLNQLYSGIASLDDGQKTRLFDLSFGRISSAPGHVRTQLREFARLSAIDVENEVRVDRWAWQYLVGSALDDSQQKPSARYGKISDVLVESVLTLSSVIYTDVEGEAASRYTFIRALSHTGLINCEILPPEDCALDKLEKALGVLRFLAPREKRKLLVACGACVTSNREIVAAETWIMRAICHALGFSMPQLLPGQPVTPGT
ncbi:MAG: M48 family metalloprotease [Planctomycetota bacterium]